MQTTAKLVSTVLVFIVAETCLLAQEDLVHLDFTAEITAASENWPESFAIEAGASFSGQVAYDRRLPNVSSRRDILSQFILQDGETSLLDVELGTQTLTSVSDGVLNDPSEPVPFFASHSRDGFPGGPCLYVFNMVAGIESAFNIDLDPSQSAMYFYTLGPECDYDDPPEFREVMPSFTELLVDDWFVDVRLTDVNGESYFIESRVTSITQHDTGTTVFNPNVHADVTFDIYPNPVNDVLTISMQSAQRRSITLYDFMGNRVFHSIEYSATGVLQLKHLPRGLYNLQITDLTGSSSAPLILAD